MTTVVRQNRSHAWAELWMKVEDVVFIKEQEEDEEKSMLISDITDLGNRLSMSQMETLASAIRLAYSIGKEEQPMKAFIINVKEQKIEEDTYEGDIHRIYDKCGYDVFDIARFHYDKSTNRDGACYVDDNGLLKLTNESVFFKIKGYPTPLCGNAYVLGTDMGDGESCDAPFDLEWYQENVRFMTPLEAKLWSQRNPQY